MKSRHSLILLVRRISLVLAIVACVALFAMQAEPAAADNPAQVPVIQASPDIAIVAVFVDGAKLLSSLTFGAVTDYAPVPPGAHKVQIALVGKGEAFSMYGDWTIDVSIQRPQQPLVHVRYVVMLTG